MTTKVSSSLMSIESQLYILIFVSTIKRHPFYFTITDDPSPYCNVYPNALLPHPENCAQFFDCRQRNTALGNYLRECPYLQLYSIQDKRCHNYQTITCRTRFEPKAPCKCISVRSLYVHRILLIILNFKLVLVLGFKSVFRDVLYLKKRKVFRQQKQTKLRISCVTLMLHHAVGAFLNTWAQLFKASLA